MRAGGTTRRKRVPRRRGSPDQQQRGCRRRRDPESGREEQVRPGTSESRGDVDDLPSRSRREQPRLPRRLSTASTHANERAWTSHAPTRRSHYSPGSTFLPRRANQGLCAASKCSSFGPDCSRPMTIPPGAARAMSDASSARARLVSSRPRRSRTRRPHRPDPGRLSREPRCRSSCRERTRRTFGHRVRPG